MVLRRPSLPLAVAFLALVLALVSSPLPSQAAGLVKGRQIAKNAITTPKIKDNAITAPKIRDGAVTGPKLAAGSVTGPHLAPGAVDSGVVKDGSLTAADLAPGVLPTAYWNEVAGNHQLGTAFADVVSVAVPAGSYVVTASASLVNVTGSAQDAFCRIFDGTSGLGSMRPFDISAQRNNDVTMTAVVTLATPGTASLQCRAADVSSVYTAAQSSPQAWAVGVGAVQDQSS